MNATERENFWASLDANILWRSIDLCVQTDLDREAAAISHVRLVLTMQGVCRCWRLSLQNESFWRFMYSALFKPAHDSDRMISIFDFEAFMSRQTHSDDNDHTYAHNEDKGKGGFAHNHYSTDIRDFAGANSKFLANTVTLSGVSPSTLEFFGCSPPFGAFDDDDTESPKNSVWRERFVFTCKLSWRRACLDRLRFQCRDKSCRTFTAFGSSKVCTKCATRPRTQSAARQMLRAVPRARRLPENAKKAAVSQKRKRGARKSSAHKTSFGEGNKKQ